MIVIPIYGAVCLTYCLLAGVFRWPVWVSVILSVPIGGAVGMLVCGLAAKLSRTEVRGDLLEAWVTVAGLLVLTLFLFPLFQVVSVRSQKPSLQKAPPGVPIPARAYHARNTGSV